MPVDGIIQTVYINEQPGKPFVSSHVQIIDSSATSNRSTTLGDILCHNCDMHGNIFNLTLTDGYFNYY